MLNRFRAQRFCLPTEPNDLAHHPEEPTRKGYGQGLAMICPRLLKKVASGGHMGWVNTLVFFREYPHKIWPYMLQYLHFWILEFPLIFAPNDGLISMDP